MRHLRRFGAAENLRRVESGCGWSVSSEVFGCNCPGLVCVIEDVDRKSAPVKFGSGLGPIEMPAAVPILPQSVHLQ